MCTVSSRFTSTIKVWECLLLFNAPGCNCLRFEQYGQKIGYFKVLASDMKHNLHFWLWSYGLWPHGVTFGRRLLGIEEPMHDVRAPQHQWPFEPLTMGEERWMGQDSGHPVV